MRRFCEFSCDVYGSTGYHICHQGNHYRYADWSRFGSAVYISRLGPCDGTCAPLAEQAVQEAILALPTGTDPITQEIGSDAPPQPYQDGIDGHSFPWMDRVDELDSPDMTD